jgi:hypothetical protein
MWREISALKVAVDVWSQDILGRMAEALKIGDVAIEQRPRPPSLDP